MILKEVTSCARSSFYGKLRKPLSACPVSPWLHRLELFRLHSRITNPVITTLTSLPLVLPHTLLDHII